MDGIPPGSTLGPKFPSINHRSGDQRVGTFNPGSAVISIKTFTLPVDRYASRVKKSF